MAYDERVAARVRPLLRQRRGFSERNMFGGLAFLLHGNMCCGVIERDLVLRLGNEEVVLALEEPHTRPMDFTGKVLRSMVYVAPAGYRTDAALRTWVERAVRFTKTLPAKS